MMKQNTLLGFALALLCLLGVSSSATSPGQASPGVRVWLRETWTVSYRARVQGDWLVVEVTHQPGWHTYSMDNVIRAREKSGKIRPETEIPTLITPLDGITIRGGWRQSPPLDLSTPDIRWYTWGFEGQSYFAVRIDKATLPSSVQIYAQACTEEICAMVDSLVVPVEPSETAGQQWVDPESLVAVASDVEQEER